MPEPETPGGGMKTVLCVAGARPNFMKIAPLMKAFAPRPGLRASLVHTGQHYDANMSALFFDQLGMPRPEVELGVGSGSHAAQTAAIMTAFEPVVRERRPDAVLVVGDVNSTVACGLVAVKLGVRLFHVEAGLRSFDRRMPEEINRILTDAMSDLLFCTERSGVDNLRREGVAEEKIRLVGNVMIDTLLAHRERAEAAVALETWGLVSRRYAVLTLHRPSNVDDAAALEDILAAIETVQADLPVLFPVHPRTRMALARPGLERRLAALPNLRMTEPLGYLEFLKLLGHARLALTDSGGIQEECAVLGTPCLTLRENTERPVTVELGANRIAGTTTASIRAAYRAVMDDPRPGAWPMPPLWDGRAAERIADAIEESWA